jgi:parallel beta-helix repeat protein
MIGLLLAVPTTGGSTTLWVDANGLEDGITRFQTITAALKMAALGYATIWVAPGEYKESFSIETVGVRLQASEGPEKTKIFGTIEVLVKNVFIEGFSVSPSAQAPALLIKGHRAHVRQVILENSELFGVGIENADDVVLEQITVQENAVGIHILSGHGTQIRQSRISANRLTGIRVAGPTSDCVVRANEITQNSEAGLELSGARGCEIAQNQITSNGVGLTLIEAHENTVRENAIVQQREDAMILDQAKGNTIRENQISGSRRGLVLQDSSDNTIEKNLFEAQTEIGLVLQGDAKVNTIRENSFAQNAVALALASRSDGRAPQSNWVEENAVRQNHLGIRIEVSQGGNRFRANEIVANQTDGIQIIGITQDAFLSNKIDENGQWGIRIERSAQSRFQENTFIHNGAGGLYLSDVHGVYIAKNLFSDQPLGIALEQGRDVRLFENVVTGSSVGGMRARDVERLTLTDNGIIANNGPGLDVANARTVYLDRNIFERNVQGAVLLDNSENIDLYENDFRENGSFSLRVTETVQAISARRNFWGEGLEPIIEGLEFEAIFPWLLRAAEPQAGQRTVGWLLESVSGGERLDASPQNSITLTLSSEVRGARAWVIAQALSKQFLPPLEHVVKYFAVSASGLEGGEIELKVYYREGDVPAEKETDLKIYVLEDDHWVSLSGQLLIEEKAITGTASITALQPGALFALAAPSDLSVTPATVPSLPQPPSEVPAVTQPEGNRSDGSTVIPSPVLPELEPDLHTWKFFKKTAAKGVIARLVDLFVAVLQLDWERAWHELLGFFIEEERTKSGSIMSFEKTEFPKGEALP